MLSKTIPGSLIGLLIFSTLVCAQGIISKPIPQDPQAVEGFHKAKGLFEREEDRLAIRAFQEFLTRYPNNPLADQVYYMLGLSSYRQLKFAEAIDAFQTLLISFPNSTLRSLARRGLADAFIENGMPDKAVPILELEWELAGTDEERQLLYQKLIESLIQAQSYLKAIQMLMEEFQSAGENERREAIEDQVRHIMGFGLKEADLLKIVELFPRRFPSDIALIKLVQHYEANQDLFREEEALNQFIRDFPHHDYAKKAEFLREALREEKGAKDFVIGALLPLTGPLSQYGNSVLKGLQLALDRGLDPEERPSIGLSVIDTGKKNVNLREAVDRLIRESDPVAIIGPLLSGEMKSLIPLAEWYKIPIISPTATHANLASLSPYLFQNTLTNRWQAEVLARFSMETLGLKRFVILFPEDPYGKDLSQRFAREILLRGGELIFMESYPPQTPDFKSLVKDLKKADLLRYGIEEETIIDPSAGFLKQGEGKKTALVYTPGFDAVFLPGKAQQVGLLIPQLAFFNVEGVTLLGSIGWNQDSLIRIGGRFVEGSIFVDSFFLNSPDTKVQDFINRFRIRYQKDPDLFSAQAFDSGKMVMEVLAKGVKTGPQLRDFLSRLKDFPGVTGRTSMNPNGEAEKELVFLTVVDGKITPFIKPAEIHVPF